MNYGNHFTKTECKKNAYKTKTLYYEQGPYTNIDSLELFLECQFSLFIYKYSIFLVIFLLFYGILAMSFFKFKVKLIKPNSCWYMHDWQSKEKLISSSPNSHWKHWKNIYLKLDLPHWYNFFIFSAIIFADVSSTYLESTKI